MKRTAPFTRPSAPGRIGSSGPPHDPRAWSGQSRLSSMGLLDDAIREHLELKRRRGADPAEIERDEQEALGPVRRAPEEDEQAPLEAASHADEDDYESDGADQWDDPFAEDSEALAEEPEL